MNWEKETDVLIKEKTMKRPFVSLEQLKEIIKKYPTPLYLYDEKGIRENARRLREAFAWNRGFKEYFAVKATPNLKILKEEGCGVDCSSYTELMLADVVEFRGNEIMFSSNVTPKEDFLLARKPRLTTLRLLILTMLLKISAPVNIRLFRNKEDIQNRYGFVLIN